MSHMATTWNSFPLPQGVSPLGRLFEASAILVPTSTRGLMGFRNYPGRAIVAIMGPISAAKYEDHRGFTCELHEGDVMMIHPNRTHRYGAEPGGQWNEFFSASTVPSSISWKARACCPPPRHPPFGRAISRRK